MARLARTIPDVTRRVLPLVLAAVAALALTGCDQDPSVAARVGSQTITVADVDLLTQALCVPQPGAGGGQQNAVATVNDAALATLVQAAVDAQLAEAEHVPSDPAAVNQQLTQYDALLAQVPEQDRDRTRQLIADIFSGRQQVTLAAQQRLRLGGTAPNAQVLQQAVQSLEKDWADKVGVQVNPRYDSAGLGKQGDGFESVSRAVSDDARAAGSAQPDSDWVGSLPADLRCG